MQSVVGEVMGALCKRDGPEMYVSTKDAILEGIKSNLERRPIGEAGISEQVEAGKLSEKLAGTSPKVCNLSLIYNHAFVTNHCHYQTL